MNKRQQRSKVCWLSGPPEGASVQRPTDFIGWASDFKGKPNAKWEESQSTQIQTWAHVKHCCTADGIDYSATWWPQTTKGRWEGKKYRKEDELTTIYVYPTPPPSQSQTHEQKGTVAASDEIFLLPMYHNRSFFIHFSKKYHFTPPLPCPHPQTQPA